MVTRNTWILLALFVVLAGFALFQKYYPKSEEPASDATPSATIAPVEFLFPAQEGVVTSIFIEGHEDDEKIGVERGDKGWVVTQPFEAEAEQSSVEAAASQVTALTVLTRLQIDPESTGLKSPAYSITIGFSSGNSFTAEVGEETPIGTGYYVRKEDGSILVITKEGLDALLNLLWYSPALATQTPPPSETPTQTSLPTITPTPESSATPTP